MEKIVKFVLVIVLLLSLSSCTDNYRARKLGGEMKIELDPGQKLIGANWKEANLWYLTEPMEDDYVPKTKTYQEDSRYGIMHGKVIFIERK